jgi:hypothetical protein
MMYSEFVENTGCKQNEHNYKVFQNLEAMYMNTEMTKEEIYEYGKKLVDNSKTEEEIETERKIKEEIEAYKYFIEYNNDRIAAIKEYREMFGKDEADYWRRQEIKQRQDENRYYRAQIKALKEIIA